MVLIVEDDPDMRTLERMACECVGCQVTTATNGQEALDVLEWSNVHERPCVILLDLMMPIMDGLTFLAERRRRGFDDVPVICVTAGGPELMEQARRLGAASCVAKPTDFDELCTKVGEYCCQ